MANFFDQFDPAPASTGAARGGAPPAPPGNFFDKFDEPGVTGAPAATTTTPIEGNPLRLTVRPRSRGATGAQGGPEQDVPIAEPVTAPAAIPGRGEALLRGAGQGLTMNFSDELSGLKEAAGGPDWFRTYLPGAAIMAGGVRKGLETIAPTVFGQEASERYEAGVAAERAANKAAETAHPGTYLGGELVGGVAGAIATPMLAPFRAGQSANILMRGGAATGNLAATGAAYGAVAGAGGGEGDVVDRIGPAAQGAAIGGVAAPVVGGAIRAVAGAGRFAADHARAFKSPEALADRYVGKQVSRDGANLPAIADDMERANGPAFLELPTPDGQTVRVPRVDGGGGQQLTLADVAGSNTHGAAGNVARIPGPGRAEARRFLDERQLGSETLPAQGDRIAEQVGSLLGNRGAIETADAIVARRSAEAEKLYGIAHKRQLDYRSREGQNLLALIDRVPNAAKAKANEILRISDREGHQLIWNPTPNGDGGFTLASAPNSRHFDYIKRGLDTIISDNQNPLTGELNTLGAAVAGLKREILESLDKLNPAYRAARKVYAGDTELLDALRAGSQTFAPSMSTEAVTKALARMSKGEVDMFRLGAANALRDRLANAGDGVDKVRLAYGNPALRAKIGAMAPDVEARKAFNDFMRNESAMFTTRSKATGGSPTAERLGDEADADGMIADVVKMGFQASTGQITAALRTAFDTMKQVRPELRGKVMGEARKLLFNPDPEAVRAFARRLETIEMKEGTRQRVLSVVMKALPGGVVTATR